VPPTQAWEASQKRSPTEEEKLEVLRADPNNWFVHGPAVPWPTNHDLEKMTNAGLRSMCIAKDLVPNGNTAQGTKAMRIKLLNKKMADKAERAEALSTALQNVVVDTEPHWKMDYKISLPVRPAPKATGGEVVKKVMEHIWAPGAAEPGTSMMIHQKMVNLLQATDGCAKERLRLIIHFTKKPVAVGPA
jgi:hypothetical protein